MFKNLKIAFKKIYCNKRGDSSFVAMPIIIVLFVGMLLFQISTLGLTSKINKLEQMAEIIAKDISITGVYDTSTDRRFDDLKNNVFNIPSASYEIQQGGSTITHKTLQIESNFVVETKDIGHLQLALLGMTKERVYYGKAVGKVENYSKF